MPFQDRLLNFKKKIHSQNGEDGIIERILEIIPERDNWCVEFGAWDGQHLSNTRFLIEKYGFNAVLIEGDPAKCEALRKFYSQNNKIIPMNRFVGWQEPETLDAILRKTDIPLNFDFLSIDIDGNDYHVLAALKQYAPKVICVEFNPSIPNDVEFVQRPNPSVSQGSSILSFVKLGNRLGYELLEILHYNAFFVKKEYFNLFGIADNSYITLRENLSYITHMFVGFDGTILFSGNQTLPWHGVKIQNKKLQALPRYLRAFPDSYTFLQKTLFYLFKQYLRITNKLKSFF